MIIDEADGKVGILFTGTDGKDGILFTGTALLYYTLSNIVAVAFYITGCCGGGFNIAFMFYGAGCCGSFDVVDYFWSSI